MFIRFLDRLEGSYTLLTANQRLSTYLIQLYDREQQARGLRAWPSLDCLPLSAWVQRQLSSKTKVQLTEFQSILLWQNIIHHYIEDHPSIHFINAWSTAKTAAAAWELLAYWQIPLAVIANTPSEDVRAFYCWARQFEHILEQQQLADSADLVRTVVKQLEEQKTTEVQNIVFAGFEETPPLIENLRGVLAKYCKIHDYDTSILPEKINQLALADQAEELKIMAAWAKHKFQLNPDLQIGCVIPQLANIRNQVERIFANTFTDGNFPIDGDLSQLPFNISVGKPLADYPLIEAAFYILETNAPKLAIHHITALLSSPFIVGAEQELINRGIFIAKLRELGQYHYPWSIVQDLLKKTRLCPALEKCLLQFSDTIHDNLHSFSFWAKLFIQQLQLWNWPGERGLSSDEFQQWQRWHTLLEEFSSLELVSKNPISFQQAIHHLYLLAKSSIFQSKTSPKPIQILGSLEAIGHRFDCCWIMGFNDLNWPAAPNPNPFLPLALQQTANMAHTSTEKEWLFCQKIFKRLKNSAEEVLFSYAQQDNDIHLFPSPLLKEIPKLDLIQLEIKQPPKSSFLSLEKFQDDRAPAIHPDEKIYGGASLIKNQAACPFRAFAINRLRASKLSSLASGFSAITRGNLIHSILENLWKEIKNHTGLCSYQGNELDELIILEINKAFAKHDSYLTSIHFHYRHIEKQRLAQLIKRWLKLEEKRPPFTVIAQEKTLTLQLDKITLKLRIDREDELENGERIIIDYKTGKPDIKGWFEERPDDPQLPLYCLINDYSITALVFAQIRSDELTFKGLSAKACDIPGVKSIGEQSIEKQISCWEDFQDWQKRILSQLAADFSAGIAKVDPKHPTTCDYCDLQALCRKYEQKTL